MWRQGEHVCILGATGTGKTTFAQELLKRRSYTIMLVTKPDTLSWSGFNVVKTERDIRVKDGHRFRLMPEPSQSKVEFQSTFDRAWKDGGWTLYLDELFHIEHQGLRKAAETHLTQGRSKHITVVTGVQRPAWVTRFAFSEPTHIFCFRLGLGEDVKAIGRELGKDYAKQIEGLPKYHFAYLNKSTGNIKTGSIKTLNEVLT